MYSINFTTFSTAINPLFSPPSSLRGTPIKAAVSTLGTESARVVSGEKSPTLYEILRVEKTASQMEIKTAYRSLAKVYHPDVSGTEDGKHSDGSDFIVIRNAYETLLDPVARAVYDLSLGNGRRGDKPVGFSNGYNRSRRWETDQCW